MSVSRLGTGFFKFDIAAAPGQELRYSCCYWMCCAAVKLSRGQLNTDNNDKTRRYLYLYFWKNKSNIIKSATALARMACQGWVFVVGCLCFPHVVFLCVYCWFGIVCVPPQQKKANTSPPWFWPHRASLPECAISSRIVFASISHLFKHGNGRHVWCLLTPFPFAHATCKPSKTNCF